MQIWFLLPPNTPRRRSSWEHRRCSRGFPWVRGDRSRCQLPRAQHQGFTNYILLASCLPMFSVPRFPISNRLLNMIRHLNEGIGLILKLLRLGCDGGRCPLCVTEHTHGRVWRESVRGIQCKPAICWKVKNPAVLDSWWQCVIFSSGPSSCKVSGSPTVRVLSYPLAGWRLSGRQLLLVFQKFQICRTILHAQWLQFVPPQFKQHIFPTPCVSAFQFLVNWTDPRNINMRTTIFSVKSKTRLKGCIYAWNLGGSERADAFARHRELALSSNRAHLSSFPKGQQRSELNPRAKTMLFEHHTESTVRLVLRKFKRLIRGLQPSFGSRHFLGSKCLESRCVVTMSWKSLGCDEMLREH